MTLRMEGKRRRPASAFHYTVHFEGGRKSRKSFWWFEGKHPGLGEQEVLQSLSLFPVWCSVQGRLVVPLLAPGGRWQISKSILQVPGEDSLLQQQLLGAWKHFWQPACQTSRPHARRHAWKEEEPSAACVSYSGVCRPFQKVLPGHMAAPQAPAAFHLWPVSSYVSWMEFKQTKKHQQIRMKKKTQ